ncbi:MAG: Mrp/NBP35 family ATP-binding protein [Myxococcales bacterium]|nr:Mrp/NBP35 family ATP-binding protein [Myxococcales bacterium]
MSLNKTDVLSALSRVIDPDIGADIVTLNLVQDVTIDGSNVGVTIALRSFADPAEETLASAVKEALRALPGVTGSDVRMTVAVPQAQLPRAERMPTVRHIIGVGAGKGGVGKSTVAVNLAVALARAGARVGLLDADIYGPSVPIMMGLSGSRPRVNAENKIIPLVNHGVRFMSMGLLVKPDEAVVWRGPMIGRAVTQFIDDVAWGELDYLIVDLPPGTGDVVLTLSQTIPLSGAVVVSTPQDVAFADVQRAIRMFRMLKVDVVGLVENMAFFVCPDNDKTYWIFGQSRTAEQCAEHELDLLGTLPIEMAISPNADKGLPIVAAEPESAHAALYTKLAGRTVKALAVLDHARSQGPDHSDFFASAPSAT